MKRFNALWLGLVMSAALGAPALAQEEGARLGYVDLRKVILESKHGQRNKAEIEKLVKQKQDQLVKEEAKIKALQQDFEKNKLVLNEQQKKDKQKEFQEKVQAFQKLRAESEKEITAKDAEFTQKALGEIRAIVATIAKEMKLLMVFDRNGQPFYAAPGPDLTDVVLKQYDAKSGK